MRMSLCMIVRQEEKALARCLEGIADAVEEIIIVDMGSTDGTKEIARQFTDKIYDFPWGDDFAAARNLRFPRGRESICCGWMRRIFCHQGRRKSCLL